MISSAIWCNKHEHEPVGQVQFVFFEKFTKAYYTYLQEIMLFLVNNVHDITSQSVRTDKILKACAHYS